MELKPEIVELLSKLEEKYSAMGQDMTAYLEGLLYANSVDYWDYIQVDTLLSLQKPRTDIPDEKIFIMYHQVTELYFNMILNEYQQLGDNDDLSADELIMRAKRINRYFDALTQSFDIMGEGMEAKQFLKFRMALLPASGFQSAQYRKIEICSTDFINLVAKDVRSNYKVDSPLEEMFEHIYWKAGATELATGKKTLTLEKFEERYTNELVAFAEEWKDKNLWRKYLKLSEDAKNNEELQAALKDIDLNVNVNWPLVHYRSAAKYLQRDPADIAATGGTNWQKYLPPRFQKRIFYPTLWTEQEIEEWGKSGIISQLLR